MPEGKSLNQEQLEAVEFGTGPLLIIAGAGTGKTTVITERIKHLVSTGLAKPSEILALTFTDKAAREMEERVDRAMPYGYTQMWISTFHSFGDRILKAEAISIGLNPRYHLMNTAENIQFIRKNLFKFDLNYFRPLGNPNRFIEGIINHFSRLKDEDVSSSEYFHWAQSQNSNLKTQIEEERQEIAKYLELANAYITYEDLKTKEGRMDFGDLIANLLKLFRERKAILKRYQEQFKFILVDEFQDTNFAQNELAIILAGSKQNITVCADDDQAIYRWRGAAVSNVLQFRQRFPQAKIVVLTKNYRSTQEILDKSYSLIQFNNPDRLEIKEKIIKKLESMREQRGEKIILLNADRVENEAVRVSSEIINLKLAHPEYKYSDFAVLVRANSQADPFTRAFSRAGIPFQFLGPGALFRQAEVKDLIAYLEVLANFENSVAMYRVLTLDHFDISTRDLAGVLNFAKKQNLPLFEACEKVELISVTSQTKEKIEKIIKMIHRHLELVPKETAGQILYFFLEDTGILRKLTDYKTASDERKAQNISKFFNKLKTYEAEHEDASVYAVSEWINLSFEIGESPQAADLDWTDVDAVNILTVHSAKGLEFPVVFLVNLVSGRFPTTEKREQIPLPEGVIKEILPEGDFHLQEERRLFYVGMTRAMDKLYLTASNFYGEAKRERKISQFVVETLGESVVKQSGRFIPSEVEGLRTSQLSLLEWQKPKEKPLQPPFTLPVNFLSYSQIETFNTCPRQYRYRYIQRIPVPARGALSFGESVHRSLLEFYKAVKEGKSPSKKDLIDYFEKTWLNEGYTSREHAEKMKKQGREILSRFYDQGYEPGKIPVSLEQNFVIGISPSLKIGGKIDRIDKHEDGTLEIIDYKTGKAYSEEKINNNLQMTVYGLALTDKGLYCKKPEEILLSFYFLEKGEKVTSKRTNEELEKAKKDLIDKKREIETSDFAPKPGEMCKYCEYQLMCEAY